MEGFSLVCLLVWIVVLTGAVFGVRHVGGVLLFIYLYVYIYVVLF